MNQEERSSFEELVGHKRNRGIKMNKFGLLLIAILMFGCLKDKSVKIYNDGIISEEYAVTNGEKNGYYKKFYPSGKIEIIGNYRFDRADGVFTYFYQNGKISMRSVYKNGSRDGPFQQYDSLGNVEVSGVMTAGISNGQFRWFYPGGKLKEIEEYEEGNLYHSIEFDKDGDTTSDTWYAQVLSPNSVKLGDTVMASLFYHKISSCIDSIFTLYIVPQKVYDDYENKIIKKITGKVILIKDDASFTYVPTVKGKYRIWGSIRFKCPEKPAAYFEKTFEVY